MYKRDSTPWYVLVLLGACLAWACDDGKAERGADASTEAHGFVSADVCATCHPGHYAQWTISNHAYAVADPVFDAMVQLGQAQTEGAIDQFCIQCHSPLASLMGQTPVLQDGAGKHSQPLGELDILGRQGVSCDVCHTMVDPGAPFNAGMELDPDGTRRASITDPVDNDFHRSESSAMFGQSDMCGSCHNVRSELYKEPFFIELTFREWQVSGFNGSRDCQDCHMPESMGEAAQGGPQRLIHDHSMVGVDVSLLPPEEFPGYEKMRELTRDLLQDSADFSGRYNGDTASLELRIDNKAGHSLPSGATLDREMWIELTVTDGDGEIAFASGTLDGRGDLRHTNPDHTMEPGTDPQLVLYRQHVYFDPKLEDPSSDEPEREVDFLWEPNRMSSNIIPAKGFDDPSYDLSALPPGNYTATARLLFRSFPPHLLRKLEEEAGLDPAVKDRVPTVEMERVELSFAR